MRSGGSFSKNFAAGSSSAGKMNHRVGVKASRRALGEVSNAQLTREVEAAFSALSARKPVYRRYLNPGFNFGCRERPAATMAELPMVASARPLDVARAYEAMPDPPRGTLKQLCAAHGVNYNSVAQLVTRLRHGRRDARRAA